MLKHNNCFLCSNKNVPIGDKNPIQDKTGQRPCLLCLYLLSKFQWGLWYTDHHLPQSRPACIAERHSKSY